MEEKEMTNEELENNQPQKEQDTPEHEESKAKKSSDFFGRKDKKEKQIEALQKEVEDIQAEKNDIHDKYIRLYSEFDNYRKRTQKEKLETIKNASEDVIVSLLPIIDDLERAVKFNNEAPIEDDFLKEGMVLILQKIKAILKQKGLEEIDTENAFFDTDYHEAISILPTDNEKDKGKIIEEIEKGYILNGKVIRFSKVIIYQ